MACQRACPERGCKTVFVATIGQVEKRISDVEGFRVRILHGRDRRDVRSDRARLKQYGF
jgi:hypothetical protein